MDNHFSKGPWSISGIDLSRPVTGHCMAIWSEGNDRQAVCLLTMQTAEKIIDWHNAALISAAPDMFHALQKVRASSEWACMESDTQDAVIAAIAKANGTTN